MIIMDLKFQNVLGFKDIHFNFSYPRKIKKKRYLQTGDDF